MSDLPAVLKIGLTKAEALTLGENRWYTVFLFGAGASFGCGEVLPHSPPAGDKLYAALRKSFPDSWGALPSSLAGLFEESFETGMDALWKEDFDKCSLLLQQMGIYFADFIPAPGADNLYRRIIRRLTELRSASVLFSTLNYECLLDGEMMAAGLKVTYLFPPDGPTPLLKLHGSCNWYMDGVARGFNYKSGIRWEGQVRALSSAAQVKAHFEGDTSLSPVICLYTADKPAPICPSLFKHIQGEWAAQIRAARQVALIGVRPYPKDTHIWEPLKETQARLVVIGNRQAYSDWHRASGREGKTDVIAERFNEGVDDLMKTLGL